MSITNQEAFMPIPKQQALDILLRLELECYSDGAIMASVLLMHAYEYVSEQD
jgi:hypothetical protein